MRKLSTLLASSNNKTRLGITLVLMILCFIALYVTTEYELPTSKVITLNLNQECIPHTYGSVCPTLYVPAVQIILTSSQQSQVFVITNTSQVRSQQVHITVTDPTWIQITNTQGGSLPSMIKPRSSVTLRVSIINSHTTLDNSGINIDTGDTLNSSFIDVRYSNNLQLLEQGFIHSIGTDSTANVFFKIAAITVNLFMLLWTLYSIAHKALPFIAKRKNIIVFTLLSLALASILYALMIAYIWYLITAAS